MIDHRHVIFVLAVVKVAKRDVTAVRSLVAVVTVLIRGSNRCVEFASAVP